MMKKIKYILVLFMILSQFSCETWLERIPPGGLIREEFWKSKADVNAVLMGAYGAFAKMDRKLFVFGESRADLLEDGTNLNWSEKVLMQNTIYSNNGNANWRSFYEIINYANEVIKNAPLVQEVDNTFTDYQMQGLVSEAYFLRSLCYFYLVRIFKEVPLVLEPSETDDSEFYLEKSSEEEVLNQIVSDLESNRVFAPSQSFPTEEENKGRASKAAFDALLADIELWRFNYDKVIEHVQKIEVTEKFVLMPPGKWFEIFYPGNSLEGIFEFQFNDALDQTNKTYGLTNRNGRQYIPSQRALEMFGFEYAFELVRGEKSSIRKYGEDEYIVWKYVGSAPDGQSVRPGSQQRSCNWIVYRYADVLLMKAEALSQLERFNEAREIIQEIRDRAGVAPLPIADTKVAYEDAILEERALELAFEGKRWFDLLRMGRRNDYARKSKLIEIIVANVPSSQKRILATKLTNPMGWYMPIYENELERNKSLVQNPYYDF